MGLRVSCQVLVASEVTGLIALGEMARDSLEVSRLPLASWLIPTIIMQYSTLEPSEKERAIAQWEKRWLKFVDEVAAMGNDSV
jgi:adenosine deaminase CECR1